MALQPILFGGASLGPDLSKMQSSYDNARKNALAEQTARAQTEQQNQLKAILSSGNPFSPEVYSRVAPFDPEMAGKLAAEGRAQGVETRAQSKFDTEARQTVLQEGQKKMAGLIANLVISGGSDEALMALEDAATTPEQRAEVERYWKMQPKFRQADALGKPGVPEIVKEFGSNPTVIGSAETGMGYIERNPLSPNYNGGVPRAIGNAPQAAGQIASGGGDGSFESVIGPLIQTEGGFVAKDGRSGAPANFGINQRANPDIDVANLTVDQAKQIYRDRYWPKIEANVPPQARAAVFDMGVNAGPDTALRLWGRAGGDLNRFADLRMQYYQSLPDWEQNKGGWTARVEKYRPVANPASPMFSAPKAPLPPKPAEQWVDTTRNGVPGQRNSATQEFKPLPEYAIKAGAGAAQTPAARETEIANSAAKVLAAKDMMTTIERAKGLAGFGETGFIGSLTRNIGGTKSLALKNMVTTLQANLSFDNLKKMRDESKTGGALGNITNRELELLASTVASLDPNMEQPEFLKSVAAIEQRYARIISAANKDAFPNAPSIGSVVKNHTYNGGDPRDQANWTKVR